MPEQTDKLSELEDLYQHLVEYSILTDEYLSNKKFSKSQQVRIAELFEIICLQIGRYGNIISELSRVKSVDVSGKECDMWTIATKFPPDKLASSALRFCIPATKRAIGQLQEDIQRGLRDKKGNPIKPKVTNTGQIPKAFIAYGGKSGVLDKLREFIEALGIKPVIVELSASRGMSVDDKVNKYIKDADCGIVLATRGGIVDEKGKKQHPRLNVIDELERLRAAFPSETILLLEKGVDLPSNLSGLTYEPFARQSMDRAFTAIARELTAFGILKAVKPPSEE